MVRGHFELCKHYITYRYTRALVRQSNTTDDRILSLIDCSNEEAKQENANKNPVINSTQRDYMAGEVSRDLTERLLLPEDIVKAHEEGLIHFHDMDYYAQHMHNCDLVNLEGMLQNGTVITPPAILPRRSSPRLLPTSTAASPSPSPTWPHLYRSAGRRFAGNWTRSLLRLALPWMKRPGKRWWSVGCARK